MTQYIDKSAVVAVIPKSDLVAEIERRIQVCQDYAKCNLTENTRIGNEAQRLELNYMLSFINNLEVKEVDLEKEYKDFIKSDNGRSMFETAKHFFELGLKAQKE